MRRSKSLNFLILILLLNMSCNTADRNIKSNQTDQMLVRISEIKIDPNFLDEYLSILKEEASASVRLEPGVISIYPMFQKDDSTEIRILEIYANREAYETHLQTPHFKLYKTSTIKMVESLNLVDMESLDKEIMKLIFQKLE